MKGVIPETSCNAAGKKAPRELLAHLKEKAKMCKFHDVTFRFLEELYSNHYKAGFRHIAFDDLNSTKYRETLNLLGRRVQK